MLVSFPNCDIKDADEAVLFKRTYFIYRNGVAAVWQEDLDDGSAIRLAHVEGVTFTRRRSASKPHILTLADSSEWHIWPKHGGSCCGGSRASNLSYAQLLDPDLTAL